MCAILSVRVLGRFGDYRHQYTDAKIYRDYTAPAPLPRPSEVNASKEIALGPWPVRGKHGALVEGTEPTVEEVSMKIRCQREYSQRTPSKGIERRLA